MKYIDADLLKTGLIHLREKFPILTYEAVLSLIASLQQEQPKEIKLPSKRTRVNYAICKLQAFKPLREAIVLDDYVYDEGKCFKDNLLNYIHAIPESRLSEIRSYLKVKGWWPYDDDADWVEQEQEQPKVDLEKYISVKLRELGADLINHKPYSFNRGLNVGKTSAYNDILKKINARKEE